MESLTKCPKCGRDLFEMVEEDGKSKLKIFTSYGAKTEGDHEVFYCFECYEKLGKKIFEEESNDSV